jgi:RNA polymerase sigma-70 factor (ECF subfamily)
MKTVPKRDVNKEAARINEGREIPHSGDDTIHNGASDEELVARVAQGDSGSLEILYDRYASAVLGISVKVSGDRTVAEDVLQETFWHVWKSADTYQSQRGSFTGWLFKIVRNLAIDAYRRRSARPQENKNVENSDPVLDQIADPGGDVVEHVQSGFRDQQVRSALMSLPYEQKQVLELAYFYGMTRQEIAEATGEALGTIHTRARLGLQKLREKLTKVEFEG